MDCLPVELKWAPMRSTDDFLFNSARFEQPTWSDLRRWCNRVVNNLLYYQTNYFCLLTVFSLLIGLSRPRDMLVGITVLLLTVVAFGYTAARHPSLTHIKKGYPLISLICVVCSLYLLVCTRDAVIFSLFSLALPMLMVFVHASFRLRNLKNKIEAKAEKLGVVKSPMGRLMDVLGLEPERIE